MKDHDLHGLRAEDEPSDPPEWMLSPSVHDNGRDFVVAIHGQGTGEVEMWTNFGDPVLLHLMLEGSAQALAMLLVSEGYVADERLPGGWRKE